MSILTYQPVKGIYALSALAFELARFPLWLAKYFLKYGRQHPKWSFGQALGVRVFFSFVYHAAMVQVKTPLPLTPGKEKERFVLVDPASSDYYKGPLLSNKDVKPEKIGGTWYSAPLTEESDVSWVTVVLHIHGGAFIIGDGRTAASGFFAKQLLENVGVTHVFCPQYRLSTLPVSTTSNPFPAALQDSITSYLYLVNTLKISPKRIVISGDSAGANLAISMLRYISEFGSDANIPSPGAAFLWSPWINPTDASDDFTRTNPNYNTDYLSHPFTKWGVTAYAGLPGVSDVQKPYVLHKKASFKSSVPMFVNAGTAEVLYFDIVEFTDSMKKAGNDVTLDEEPDAPHDVLLLGNQIGFTEAATMSAKRAGGWLRKIKEKMGE
ncbi:alpha/beta-hydrolase [Polyplosphaeria fusca]|uniref:Alpha/beta-hydrolase n=1 Tax=Polyplosphaeria fusca TaxID=682080 RepID=A0A9P4QPA5_9PLEO|nr:alpha/beta-hydrolase [Polyplosphaeria fusca]